MSSEPLPFDQPEEDPADQLLRAHAHELRLVAMREHSLLSLFELSHELTVALDEAGIADLALFNLMGHLGTAQAALFLESEARPGTLQIVRSHGVRPEIAEALAAALESAIPLCPGRFATPVRFDEAAGIVEPAALDMAERVGLALLAPLMAGTRAIGFVMLGRRARGASFSDLDLDVLNASLGMVAVAFENRRLYSRLEEQNKGLARANRELRELDQMKSEFLQNVNHELRTPLAVIIGCVDCLMQDPEEHPHRRHFLAGVLEQAHKLRGMVQTLLDYSSTLDGSLDLVIEELDVQELVSGYHESRRITVAERHPDFPLTIAGEIPTVRTDRKRLTQVLDVLLDNAKKFTPPATRLELRVREARADEPWVHVDVADSGPGIPAEQIGQLFKPFRQVDGSSTRPVGGLGMGLATANRIAEQMGARLSVETKLGAGATFTLSLPIA